MSNRNRFIIGILLAVNLFVGSFVFARRYSSASMPISPPGNDSLPMLELQDDSGNEFNTKQFIGSPLFVQFINPYVDAQIASLVKTRRNHPERPVSWLLITKDARELRKHLQEAVRM
jgi:hypothetical protein